MTACMTQKALALTGATTLSLMIAQGVAAQTQAELVSAFAGDWFVFDPAFRSGSGECRIVLDPQMSATETGCGAALVGLAAWRIEEGQIILVDGADQMIAAMGGNQQRITGTLADSGLGLIVERAAGDGTGAAINAALGRHRCYFLGFTQTCADDAALTMPQPGAEDPALGRIEVLANLNVRNQPRRDAPVIGVLQEGTPVTLDYCTLASDGLWCRAVFGTEPGWLARAALRQNEWPVITYSLALDAPADSATPPEPSRAP